MFAFCIDVYIRSYDGVICMLKIIYIYIYIYIYISSLYASAATRFCFMSTVTPSLVSTGAILNKEIGWEVMGWTDLAQDTDKWQAVVNMVTRHRAT